jgi:MFS family permease
VNVLFGAGAATGAVLGGFMADKYGWRSAFWVQIPAIAIATLLVVWKVHVPMVTGGGTKWEKFKGIDWAGTFVLVIAVSNLDMVNSDMN